MELNNYPVGEYKIIDGVYYFSYRNIISCYKNGMQNLAQFNELKKISDIHKHRTCSRGRNSITLINGYGISEWINHSIIFTPHEKRKFINELKQKKLIDINICAISTTKEKNFFSNLEEFLIEQDKSYDIKYQVNYNSYFIDCVINNKYAIEFDENKHISYDSRLEKIREDVIREKYLLIRVNDIDSIGKSIGIIYNLLK
jgi:hypothetical protein